MSTVKADTILAASQPLDISLGASGDTVTVAADSINVNKVQDKGGNTLWDYSTGAFVAGNKAFGSQNLKLLTTQTAALDTRWASMSFTAGIDSTYDVYIFKFIEMNPYTDAVQFLVNFSDDGGSRYDLTKTTTVFQTTHYEDNSNAYLSYATGDDLAQSTAFQHLATGMGNAADECGAGELYLFNPSNTTYIKHFYCRFQLYCYPDISRECWIQGYINTTSAVNAIQFKMSGGEMDGIIKMYGLL